MLTKYILLEICTNEYISYISGFPCKDFRAESSISFWEKLSYALGIKNKKTLSTNKAIMSQVINDQANAPNLKIGVCFAKNTPYEYRDLYNMVPNHQLTLKSAEGNTCWVSNPWFNWIEKGVDKELFMEHIENMQLPMQW